MASVPATRHARTAAKSHARDAFPLIASTLGGESPTNRASSFQINFFPPGRETRHPGDREPTTRPEPRAYRLRRVGNSRSDRLARDGPPGATEWRRTRGVTSTRRAVFSHDSYPPGQIFAMTSERTVSVIKRGARRIVSLRRRHAAPTAIGARTTHGIGELGRRAGGGWRRCGRLKTLRTRVGVNQCRFRLRQI